MNRRTFVQRTGGALVALAAIGTSAFTSGCNNIFTDILNWVPVGLSAISSVLTLLSGAGLVLGPGVMVIMGLIQAGMADLKLAIVQYQSTTPPPAGSLAKIDAFLSDLVSNIGNVMQQLPGGTSNVITLVVGLFELVLSTIQGFITQVPMAAAMPRTKAMLARPLMVNGRAVVIYPRTNLSRRHFIHDFNALATAGGHPEAKLHESLLQHL